MPLNLVILGRQGSGKGTQSALLVEALGCVHLSTGDVLRAAASAGTELGLQAKAVMDSGGLVSDHIMVGIVAERLASDDIVSHGVLLDGFPRTADQADALVSILADLQQQLTMAINVDVPVDAVTDRMMQRGRADDTAEAISRRLELYEQQTAPLLDWFSERKLLVTVDGLGTVEEVFSRIMTAIKKHLGADRTNPLT